MYEDITKPPAPLPTPQLQTLQTGFSLLPPLLRRGDRGPGLVILCADKDESQRISIVDGVPPPLLKWAEEGYTVVEIQRSAFSGSKNAKDVLSEAAEALSQSNHCEPKEKVALVCKLIAP